MFGLSGLLLLLSGGVAVSGVSHTFTPSSLTSSLGHVEQLDTSGSSSNPDVWSCNNDEFNEYCMYLEVYNTGCSGIETINVTVHGANVGGALDLYWIFSHENNFFTIFNDWSATGNAGPSIAGHEDGTVLTSGYSLHAANDMFTLLSDSHNMSSVFNTLNGGNSGQNRRLLTHDFIDFGASPISLVLTNDVSGNSLSLDFDISVRNTDISTRVTLDETSFGTVSDPNENYQIFLMPSRAQVFFSQIFVDVTCSSESSQRTGNDNLFVENKAGVSSYWYAMSLLNLNASSSYVSEEYDEYDLEVSIGNDDNGWKSGELYFWGQDGVWQFTPLNNWQLPFDVKIVNTARNGETIVQYDVITTFDSEAGFDLGTNF